MSISILASYFALARSTELPFDSNDLKIVAVFYYSILSFNSHKCMLLFLMQYFPNIQEFSYQIHYFNRIFNLIVWIIYFNENFTNNLSGTDGTSLLYFCNR